HESCGAIAAAMKGGDYGYNINHLLAHLTPAIIGSGNDASVNDIAKKNAMLTVQELTNKSSVIAEAVSSGKLRMVPAFYCLGTGLVEFLD
nr:carbonic anhydrase [Bacteroidota bacterium]